jgi:hypothetical protein
MNTETTRTAPDMLDALEKMQQALEAAVRALPHDDESDAANVALYEQCEEAARTAEAAIAQMREGEAMNRLEKAQEALHAAVAELKQAAFEVECERAHATANTMWKIHVGGMLTSTYAVKCACCSKRMTDGPYALGFDHASSSVTTFRRWLERVGWTRRRLLREDGTLSVPLWVCADCGATA